jgi:SAM-dependent methyltransferase
MSTADEGSRELAAAYEGLEDPGSFAERGALEAYRQSLLDRTRAQVDFLVPHLGAQARVLEIGSGNGRVLVELARRESLALGLGLDLAESRIAFARAWAKEERLEHLRFEAADVLEVPLEAGSFSAALCITGTFAYFDAFRAGSAARVAARIHEALEPAGTLWLELYPHPEYLRLLDAAGGELRIWTELPDQDPWRYYLSRLEVDDDREILTHAKTFIHRTTGEIDQGRREQLYLYAPASIEAILRSVGFREVRLYEGWSANPYRGGEVMVVEARRPAVPGPDPRQS